MWTRARVSPRTHKGSGAAQIAAVTLALALANWASCMTSVEAGTTPCEMTIEFVTSGTWHCTDGNGGDCTICRNLSDHPSDILIRCVGQQTAERHRLPPGAELSICGGQASQAAAPHPTDRSACQDRTSRWPRAWGGVQAMNARAAAMVAAHESAHAWQTA